ncbi:MAG: helix-turn-helix domain-containing protein [Acidimicrobiales bacterium]
MVRPRKRQAEPTPPQQPAGMDVNAVVSYNVRAIRERRGMTQQAVADRLAQLTGHQLPQASISAMERGFDGERRRRFDAHELYLLSHVFDVPIAYFFIPPPGAGNAELADTRRPVAELWRSLLGTDSQLDAVDARLAEIKINDPDASDQVLAAIFGPENAATNWHTHFRTWRKRRLREIEVEYGDHLDEVAEFLAEFATKIKALGPAGYLRSTSHRAGEPVTPDEED